MLQSTLNHPARDRAGSWSRRLIRSVAARLSASSGRAASSAPQGLFEQMEPRQLLSAAFDLVGLTAARADANFSDIDGTGFSVAVIDSGLDRTHPLLAPGYRAGINLTAGSGDPIDNNGHGTHVSGTIGARDPNIGVAPDVGLIGLGVSAGGNRIDGQATVNALRWVRDNYRQYNIIAINMSLGGGFFSSAGQAAGDPREPLVRELENLGITVVAAAGNAYDQQPDQNVGAPAIFSSIAVGAVWQDGRNTNYGSDRTTGADRITFFSQRLVSSNMIFAPGALIYSTVPGGRFEEMPGTSMASPLVAGSVALLQEAAQKFGGRNLTVSEVRSFLLTNADTIRDGDDEDNSLPATNQNYLRINVHRSLQAVRTFFAQQAPGGGGSGSVGDANGVLAGAIGVPQPLGSEEIATQGTIGSDGAGATVGAKDVDLYKFQLTVPGLARFRATATGFQPVVRLFDQGGSPLGTATQAGTEVISTIQLAAGTYYLGVSANPNTTYNPTVPGSGTDGSAGGAYSVGFQLDSADGDGAIGNADEGDLGDLRQPFSIEASLGTDSNGTTDIADVDMYRILVPDNGTLLIDIDTPYEDFVDTLIRVFDEEGNELVFNDDAESTDFNGIQDEFFIGELVYDAQNNAVGHVTDSFVGGTVQRGEVYYIGISYYFNDIYNPITLEDRPASAGVGRYKLNVTFVSNDLNGSITQAVDDSIYSIGNVGQPGRIGFDGNPNTGGIQDVGNRDVDFVRLQPSATGILAIDINSVDLVGNTDPVDTVLYIFDADGNVLGGMDDSETSQDPYIEFRVQAGQVYYVGIAGYGNDTFNPFYLGSGGAGDTGYYEFATQLFPLSREEQRTDDRTGNSGRQNPQNSVAVGESRTGEIGDDGDYQVGNGDVDIYTFVPTSSGPFTISTSVVEAYENVDTFMRLLDANGNELAFNDNASSNTRQSAITYNFVSGQTYYIAISGAAPNARSYDPNTGANPPSSTARGGYILSTSIAQQTIPNEVYRSATDAVEGITASATSQHTVTTRTATGAPALYQQNAQGAWTVRNLTTAANGPSISGDVSTFTLGGVTYAVAKGQTGLTLYTQTGTNTFTSRNLTADLAAQNAINAGNLTIFKDTAGNVNIAGIADNGNLVMYSASLSGSTLTWAFTNLSVGHLGERGLATPQFVGKLVSWVTSWNGLNIGGLDQAGRVQSVWWAPGIDRNLWTTSDLSTITGAPTISGQLTVYVTGWDAVNIIGGDTTGKVLTTWWMPSFVTSGANWRTDNLTNLFQFPTLQNTTLASWTTPWGATNIVGIGADGSTSLYWWSPAVGANWQFVKLSDFIQGATPLTNSVTGYTAPNGFINLVGASASGDVIRYFWNIGTDVWSSENVTATATAE
jgi:subtilisin family serine protease